MSNSALLPLFVPYGSSTSHIRSYEFRAKLKDARALPGEDRLVWRMALSTQQRFIELASLVEGPTGQQIMWQKDVFKLGVARHTGYSGVLAFVPPQSSRELWKKIYVRDAAIRLSAFRSWAGSSNHLEALGLPSELGSNGLICAPFVGKQLLVSSLALLQMLVATSRSTWKQLRHPLNLGITVHSCPNNVLELRSRIQLPASPADLRTLAFWCTENRLNSLWNSLEGFGTPGWAFLLPDRHEEIPFCFSAYESDDLIVVDRMYQDPRAYLPNPWSQILLNHPDGEPMGGTFDGELQFAS